MVYTVCALLVSSHSCVSCQAVKDRVLITYRSQTIFPTMDEPLDNSKYETFSSLHNLVHLEIKRKKLGMKNLSSEFRKVVEQCLMELLKVTSLGSGQYSIVENFCKSVPGFYKKSKSRKGDIERHHDDYFRKPLMYFVDGVAMYVEKESVEDDVLPNLE